MWRDYIHCEIFLLFCFARLDRKRPFCVCLWTIFSLLFGSFSYLIFASIFRYTMERFVLYCLNFFYIIAFSSLVNLSMILNHFLRHTFAHLRENDRKPQKIVLFKKMSHDMQARTSITQKQKMYHFNYYCLLWILVS